MPRVFRPPAAPSAAPPPAGPPPPQTQAKRRRKVLRDNIQGITKPAIRRLARRGGVKRISDLIYEETRGVLKVFLENVLRDAVTYTEHARRKTVTAMDVVYALKRQGRTLYGFGGESTSVSRRRTPEQAQEEAVQRRARQLAFQAHQRGQPIPPNAAHLDEARRDVAAQHRPAAPAAFETAYQGQRVRAVPVGSVFAYEPTAAGGHRLAKQQGSALADELHDAVVGAEQTLCEAGTGVSVSQSLKPSADGGGLLYQANCRLIVATDAGEVKGVALICTYEVGEQLIEPRAFGDAVDAFVRGQPGAHVLMLELICARGAPLPDGRHSNHLAAKALMHGVKEYARAQSYGLVVCKAENVRSYSFLTRRGFATLFRRGNPAAMQAATASISV